MFFSTRHLMEMRERFLSVSSGEWLLLVGGLVLGGCLWLLVKRRIVQKSVEALNGRGVRGNAATFCESAMGAVIFLVNGGLLFLATQLPSYFLFSFALAGLMIGAWIWIPPDYG